MATSKNKRKLRAPKVADSELSRIFDNIYDELNKLASGPSEAAPQNIRITSVSQSELPPNPSFEDVTVDTLLFNTSYSPTGNEAQGTFYWNSDEETVSLITNGSILDLGHALEVEVKANDPSQTDIQKGTVVSANGTVGASGRITVKKFQAGTDPTKTILGITSETIVHGGDGKAIVFGKIRKINTADPEGGTWNEGDILYAGTLAGELTKTEPGEGAVKLPVAYVVTDHQNNGEIFVRITPIDENIDADKLDGQHGSYYLDYNNFNNTPTDKYVSSLNFDSNDFTVDIQYNDGSPSIEGLSWAHTHSQYLTAEVNDLTSAVTWANVPDANITQSSVTQHESALSIDKSQITNFGVYDNYQYWTLTVGLDSSNITSTDVVTFIAGDNVTLGKSGSNITINSSLPVGAIDTITTDTNSGLSSAESSGEVTITLDLDNLEVDTTVEAVDFIAFLDGPDTKKITLGNIPLGVFDNTATGFISDYTVTQADVTQHQSALAIAESQITFTSEFIELGDLSVATQPASGGGSLNYNVLTGVFTFEPAAIGTFISFADLGVTNNPASGGGNLAYDNAGNFTFTPPDLTSYLTEVTSSDVTQHEGDLTIDKSQITNFGTYDNYVSWTITDGLNSADIIKDYPLEFKGTGAANVSFNPSNKILTIDVTDDNDNYYPVTLGSEYQLNTKTLKIAVTGTDDVLIDLSSIDANELDGNDGSYYLNYNNFTNTPTIPDISSKIELTDLSVAIQPATGGGDLDYDNTTGVFTFYPASIPDVSNFITRTDISVGTPDIASGSGDLSYNSVNGVFTYTPPDLSPYLTSYTETNDLSSAVTWANVPDANITSSSVTQHIVIGLPAPPSGGGALAFTNGEFIFTPADVPDVSSFITLSEARQGLSVGVPAQPSGSGTLSYNSGNGSFTYTPPDLSSYLTEVTSGDVTQHQGDLVIDKSQITNFGTYDNYGSWSITDGTNSGNVTSSKQISFLGGGAASVSYNDSTGFVTITSTDTNTDTNYYLNGANWATGTGVLTLNVQGSPDVTVDLDGRYLTSLPSHNHDDLYYTETEVNNFLSNKDNYQSWTVKAGANQEAIASGNILEFAGAGAASVAYDANANKVTITSTDTNTDTNWYPINEDTSVANGIITLGGVGMTDVTIDLSNEFLSSHPNTSSLNGTTGGNNDGVVIEDITVDSNGHVTAIGTRDLDGRFDKYDHWSISDGSTTGDISSGNFVTFVGTNDASVTYDNSLKQVTIDVQTPAGSNYYLNSVTGNGNSTVQFDFAGDPNDLASFSHNFAHNHNNLYYTELEIQEFLDGTNSISGYNKSNWDTAYGWGDHDGIYLPLSGGTLTGSLTVGNGTADMTIRTYHSDASYTELKGYGIQFNRATSYIRPTVNSSKELLVGSSTLKWQAVKFDAGAIQFNNAGTTLMNIDGVGDVNITNDLDVGIDARIGGNLIATGTLSASGYNKSNWDIAYGWGDHSLAGYLTSLPTHNHDNLYYRELEINEFLDGTNPISGYNKSNWDTAFGWGNHASVGYLTSIPSEYLTQTEGDARYLQLTGGSLTGVLDFNNVSGRAITITADTYLDGRDASIYLGNATSNYGWDLEYQGSGSGNNNKLRFVSTNNGTPKVAFEATQDGVVNLPQSGATVNGNTILTEADYDTYVCHLKTDQNTAIAQGSANEFTVNFNVETHNDTSYFSHSNGVVTILETGWYRVYANMVYDNASSSARNTIRAYVKKNGTEILSTRTYDYDRGSSYGRFSNNKIETMLYLTANDTVEIANYAYNEDGSVTIEAAESEFIVNSVAVSANATNADTLDGEHGSYYRNASNINAGTISDARLPATISSNITGNSATATKLATAREIILGGDLFGSAFFDGNSDITISAQVSNNSHTHDDRYYTETESDARFLGISAKAADSDLLDGINGSSFLRSDADDTASGIITFNASGAAAVFGSSADGFSYTPTEGGSSGSARYWLRFDKTNNASYPYLTNRTPSGDVAIFTGTAAAGSENEHFRIKGGDGTVNAYFTNANVGIGTTSPVKNFEVEVNNSNTAVTAGNGLVGGNAGSGILIRNSNTTAGVYANLDFRANNADGRIAYKYTGTTNVGDFHFITDNLSVPISAMVIKNDGKVGIGTTLPSSELDVEGTITSNNLKLQNLTSNTSDTAALTLDQSQNVRVRTLGSNAFNSTAFWHAGNDGSGSGLDADLLDGQQGSHYTNAANLTGTIPDVFSPSTRYNIGLIDGSGNQTRDKIRVWDSSLYTIGMKSGYSYGHIGTGEYAMSFQMNDNNGRGFWWGDDVHTDAQGAMSLTTQGKLTVATSVSIGEGESITAPSSQALYVNGESSFDGVVNLLSVANDTNTTSALFINQGQDIVYRTLGANAFNSTTIPTNNNQLTNGAGYITGYTETDPVFSASAASGITSGDIADWNSSYQNSLTGASFDTGTGIVTVSAIGGSYNTVSLDGRYYTESEVNTLLSGYVSKSAPSVNDDLDMNDNDITEVGSIVLANKEGEYFNTTSGRLIFDENFYGDTEYGSTSVWTSNGGGLIIRNEDGWGRILSDKNMQYLNASFASVASSGAVTGSNLNISNWNTAYGWGNHASAGYLTSFTETDPVFTASPASGITTSDISDWDSSYQNSLSGVSFNTTNGVLTVSAVGGAYTADLDGRYLQLSGGTLTGQLTTNGLININDYEGLDMVDTYSFWRRNYVVGSNPPAQLLDKDGNALSNGGVYRFHAHISGTGTDQWATAVYWNQNGTWKLNVTQQSGTSSNHPEFIIDSNVPKIEIDHPNNYAINVFHERLNLSEGTGTDNNAGFGADGFLSNVSGILRFNPFGGTTNFGSGTERIFTDNYHPNADTLTTAREIELTGDVTGSVFFDGSGDVNIATSVANDSHTHDGRYYTETEVNNFFGGTTAITGYNKSNWDTSYQNSLSGVGFNTGTGVLTVSAIGGSYTTDLDGRYLTSFDITTQTDPKYLRSNAADTWNVGRGDVYFENNSNSNANGAGITLRTSSNPSSDSASIFDVRSSGQASRLFVGQDHTSSGYNPFYAASSNSTDAGALTSYNHKLGASSENTYLAKDGGDVGIGTTSPSQKLDVNGNIAVGGTTFVDSTRRNIYLDSFDAGGGAGIFFRDGFSYNASITAETHNSASADGICISGYDGVSISTGANTRNERMRVDVNGRVGIGDISPTYKLDVNGDGRFVSDLDVEGVLKIDTVTQDTTSTSALVWAYDGSKTVKYRTLGSNAFNSTSYLPLAGGTLTGSLNIGNGSANTRLVVDKADDNVSDHIIFEVGGTRVGEIGAQDTTWLRINQSTSKNIYTPRYIRADAGFFVDSTAKGINGSGNFIGGTIAGASDANVTDWNNAYQNSLSGLSFNTSTGVLSANVVGGSYTVDLDNRYLTSFDITTQTDPKYLRSNASDTTTGDITIGKGDPKLILNDTSTSNSTNLTAYTSYRAQGTQKGYVGFGSGSNNYLYVENLDGRVQLQGSQGVFVQDDLYIDDTNTRIHQGSGNAIRHQTNSGYIDIGPQNTTWAHIYTDRNNFYFNKNLYVTGDRVMKVSDEVADLSDYEEGTFTPTYGHTSGNPSTVTYDTGNTYGKYTKIGNVVHCSGRIRTDAITWASTSYNTVLKGFPFTCDSPLSTGTGCVAGVIGFAGGFASTKPVTFQMRDGQTAALLYGESITSSEVRGQPNIKSGDFTTGTNANKNFITFQITYHTS